MWYILSFKMSEGFVATKSSLSRQGKSSGFEEVVFTSYKKKAAEGPHTATVRSKKTLPDPVPKRADDQRAFMKKARYEVMKFGLTGFDAAKREETKQALAISLGAKPRKKKGINYKELKEARQKQKEEEKARQAFQTIGKTATGHASAKIKNRMRLNKQRPKGDHKGGLLGVYGKVRKNDLPTKKK